MPHIVPRALNSVKKPATISVELSMKYLGARGMPNHPVESNPANVSMIKRYLAKLWCLILKNKKLHP
jgi:hypothetical protein